VTESKPIGLGVGVTVRMTREQHERLKELADREHRSLSQEMRRMLDLYLADAERQVA